MEFFSNPFERKQKNEQDEHVLVSDESLHNMTEGGEFLDDALRMIDQPFVYTEESVAPGNPTGLW